MDVKENTISKGPKFPFNYVRDMAVKANGTFYNPKSESRNKDNFKSEDINSINNDNNNFNAYKTANNFFVKNTNNINKINSKEEQQQKNKENDNISAKPNQQSIIYSYEENKKQEFVIENNFANTDVENNSNNNIHINKKKNNNNENKTDNSIKKNNQKNINENNDKNKTNSNLKEESTNKQINNNNEQINFNNNLDKFKNILNSKNKNLIIENSSAKRINTAGDYQPQRQVFNLINNLKTQTNSFAVQHLCGKEYERQIKTSHENRKLGTELVPNTRLINQQMLQSDIFFTNSSGNNLQDKTNLFATKNKASEIKSFPAFLKPDYLNSDVFVLKNNEISQKKIGEKHLFQENKYRF